MGWIRALITAVAGKASHRIKRFVLFKNNMTENIQKSDKQSNYSAYCLKWQHFCNLDPRKVYVNFFCLIALLVVKTYLPQIRYIVGL